MAEGVIGMGPRGLRSVAICIAQRSRRMRLPREVKPHEASASKLTAVSFAILVTRFRSIESLHNAATTAGVISVSERTCETMNSRAGPNASVATGFSVWLRVDKSSMLP